MKENQSVLSSKLGGGPHGVGDPDDKTLRKVEIEVLIPQKMRDIAKVEKCAEEVAAFSDCGKQSGLSVVFFCRDQNQKLKDCLLRWYKDDAFKARCTNEYLDERSEFRRTGITKKKLKNIRELRHELSLEGKM